MGTHLTKPPTTCKVQMQQVSFPISAQRRIHQSLGGSSSLFGGSSKFSLSLFPDKSSFLKISFRPLEVERRMLIVELSHRTNTSHISHHRKPKPEFFFSPGLNRRTLTVLRRSKLLFKGLLNLQLGFSWSSLSQCALL